ncbi:MAG: 3-oxoacyl-[acyl-carrier-protein] synthase [Myxococcales bacterium]|jgi:3-oxoacyl-[acyl-carrier-protein] synthase-3|nr:3-oxoacyl-[acyl-carrier-protein] synthase [Myxococcales bacterium]
MIRSRIIGTGRGVPPRVLTNEEISKTVDTSDAWIVERTGIRERHILEPSLAASDLATEAARNACLKAGVDPSTIDCIILGTVTGDCPFPSTATFVQKKLGAKAGGCAFDLSAACAGFIYGLSVGDAFIRCGQYKRVLVIGVEVLTRIIDWTDRGTCVLFGDGAGAVLLAPDDDPKRGILSTHLYADGNYTDALYQPAGGSREPPSEKTVAEKRHYVKMNGREVYKHAVRNMASAAKTALEANALTPSDVAWVIAHQANLRIIEGVAERVAIPMDRFYINVDRYGNTSSASVPTALDEAFENGKLKSGDLLLFSALGGGLAWASAAVRW